ncbi:hypothetical protein ACVWZA_004057 [Sphingomonas sp. UYAg733]
MTLEVSAATRQTLKGMMALVAILEMGGCATGEKMVRPSVPTPHFDASAFFVGRTTGEGILKIMFRRPEIIHVDGTGHVLGDRTIVLDQSVRREGHRTTQRQWRLRPEGRGGYVGTLSDAAGPVVGTVDGNRLHLAFRLKGGLRAEQWLSLDGNGMMAHNVMIVRKFGVPVAHLTETITRAPA